MNKIKLTAFALTLLTAASLFAGCAGSSSNTLIGGNQNKTKTVTLKQFLDSGPKVGFEDYNLPLDKDDVVDKMYLFEGGKVYYVQSYDEYYQKTDESKLTWGEVAKMSDKELLAFAEKYKTLQAENAALHLEYDMDEKCVKNAHKSTDRITELGIAYLSAKSFENGYLTLDKETLMASFTVYYGCQGFNTVEEDKAELLVDMNGNIYFAPNQSYLIDPSVFHEYYEYDGYYEKFTEYTPYDGRYGEITLPEFTYRAVYRELSTGEYSFAITTDNTGNNVEYEDVRVEVKKSNGEINMSSEFAFCDDSKRSYTVYESTFVEFLTGFDKYGFPCNGLIFRTNENLTVTLDRIGDRGIDVD